MGPGRLAPQAEHTVYKGFSDVKGKPPAPGSPSHGGRASRCAVRDAGRALRSGQATPPRNAAPLVVFRLRRLEGGYDPQRVAEAAVRHVRALAGAEG